MQSTNAITQLWPVLLLIVAAGAIKAALQKQERTHEQPKARRPLTDREQSMFLRLTQALPEHIVLAQVSFSALLDAKTQRARNRFNQKTADFVICDKAFNVVAEVELDDSSHNGRSKQDANRDNMLKDAGYKVIRFNNVPTVAAIQSALTSSNTANRTGG